MAPVTQEITEVAALAAAGMRGNIMLTLHGNANLWVLVG